MGQALDRSLPSHLAADAPSLLGTNLVFRVPVRHPHPPSKVGREGAGREGGKDGTDDEEKLLVTVLVAKAIHSQAPPPPPTAAATTGKEEGQKENDPPLILLLHGFPDDASTFHAQILPFATAGFDVIVPVMPGYEPSTALLPSESYSLPALAAMLEDVVEWAMATSFAHGEEEEEEEEEEEKEEEGEGEKKKKEKRVEKKE